MGRVRNPPHFHRMQNSWSFAKVFRGSTSVLYREPKLLKVIFTLAVQRAANVSVLYREPKLLKDRVPIHEAMRRYRGFSALP